MKNFLSVLTNHFNKPMRTMQPEKVYYFHLRNVHPQTNVISAKGGVTVAMKLGSNDIIGAAAAICSAKDNFCRKKGRDIALARLNEMSIDFYREYAKNEHDAAIMSEYTMIEDIAFRLVEDIPVSEAARLVEEDVIFVTEYALQAV